MPERGRGPYSVLSHHLWSPGVHAGLPYLAAGGSCHLGDLRELWQAGRKKATFVPTPPPPLGTAFTI